MIRLMILAYAVGYLGSMKMRLDDLIRKYNVPAPRYTSYPAVPFWDADSFSLEHWREVARQCFSESNASNGLSLYIHLPFCESLCTYCACNTRITKNHAVEERYSQALLREWNTYLELWKTLPVIREIHLGGGTPTFFSPANLERLLVSIQSQSLIHPDHSFSFEGHPNNTTRDHLAVLARRGFTRVSFGVQDLDEKVQKAINRIQPFENLERAVRDSRTTGYASVSFDLVYGLPFQTVESITHTAERVIELMPDRISFYSYAHVPWMRPGQRGYEDSNLPSDVEKRSLYEAGRSLFLKAGYIDVGMDHFALKTDALAAALDANTLHRNFMGYTTTKTDLLIGLGASAISDARYAYAQNEKNVEAYEAKVMAGELAITKGHVHTYQDRLVRQMILDLTCQGKLSRAQVLQACGWNENIPSQLVEMKEEGLIQMEQGILQVTTVGRAFIRNICQLFDQRMKEKASTTKPAFSLSI